MSEESWRECHDRREVDMPLKRIRPLLLKWLGSGHVTMAMDKRASHDPTLEDIDRNRTQDFAYKTLTARR